MIYTGMDEDEFEHVETLRESPSGGGGSSGKKKTRKAPVVVEQLGDGAAREAHSQVRSWLRRGAFPCPSLLCPALPCRMLCSTLPCPARHVVPCPALPYVSCQEM